MAKLLPDKAGIAADDGVTDLRKTFAAAKKRFCGREPDIFALA